MNQKQKGDTREEEITYLDGSDSYHALGICGPDVCCRDDA